MKQACGNTAQNIFLHALLPLRGCDVTAILHSWLVGWLVRLEAFRNEEDVKALVS